MTQCKICGGELGVLGILGLFCWYQCRNCGMQFSRKLRRRKPKVKTS